MTDTTESIKAASVPLDAGAVAEANAAPAPATAVEQWVATLENRIKTIEAHIGIGWLAGAEDVINAAVPLVDIADPAAAPILARLPVLEAAVNRLTGAATIPAPVNDFGDKQ